MKGGRVARLSIVLGSALALGMGIEAGRDFALAIFRYGGTITQGFVSVFYWMTSPGHGLLNGFLWSIALALICGLLWMVRAKR